VKKLSLLRLAIHAKTTK